MLGENKPTLRQNVLGGLAAGGGVGITMAALKGMYTVATILAVVVILSSILFYRAPG